MLGSNSRPVLMRGVRYRWDKLRQQHELLFPEGLLVLNDTAAAIVKLCDGRSCDEICDVLVNSFPGSDVQNEVITFLDRLDKRRLIRDDNS